LQKNTTFT